MLKYTYDAVGNVTQTTAYATALVSGRGVVVDNFGGVPGVHFLDMGTTTDMTFKYRVSGSNGAWSTLSMGNSNPFGTGTLPGAFTLTPSNYFTIGQTYEFDMVATNGATEVKRARATFTYNGANSTISTFTAYNAMTLAGIQTTVAEIANPALDHTTRTVYDTLNQAVYSIDALGNVTQNTYDAFGRISQTTQYATAINLTGALTTAQISAAVTADSANDQTNTFTYDTLGRLSTSTDGEGYTETTTYDSFGNKKSYTNKEGNVWTYDYDALGRMTSEHDPLVDVAEITVNGRTLGTSTTSVSIETRMQYDAFGNLTALIEAYGSASSRTTQYQYDLLGHQIKTIYPTVDIYNSATDVVTSSTSTQSAIVSDYAWTRSDIRPYIVGTLTPALIQTSGTSINIKGLIPYDDASPTSVKATVIRTSDNVIVSTATTEVGYDVASTYGSTWTALSIATPSIPGGYSWPF